MGSGTLAENIIKREVVDKAKVDKKVSALMSMYGINDQANSFTQNLENYLANPDFNSNYKPEFEARFDGWTEEEIKLFISLYTEAHEQYHLQQIQPEIMARANSVQESAINTLEQT